jgi:hypothetical protein
VAVAFVVVNTSARKLMATGSEGANPLQVRVVLDPAGPAAGEMAHLAPAGMATGGLVVPVGPAVRSVAVTEGGLEDIVEAAWWVVARAVQPVTARAAVNKTVAMMRAGRMATSLCRSTTWECPGHQLGLGRSRHGSGRASRQRRTGLDPVAIFDRNEHGSRSSEPPGGQQQPVPRATP